MPTGYSARCKVCNSPHRAEVEKWIKVDRVSVRDASRRLAELGERISHEAIRRHMVEHFDVNAEVREQYRKSQERFEQEVQKRLSDIEMLDAIARGDYELHQAARAWLAELVAERVAKIPKALVDLLATTAGEVRQHLKQKAELLGDDPTSRLADGLASWAELVQAVDDEQG